MHSMSFFSNDHNKHIRLQQKLEMTQEELFKIESGIFF
jgi:hypothetical protein